MLNSTHLADAVDQVAAHVDLAQRQLVVVLLGGVQRNQVVKLTAIGLLGTVKCRAAR